MCNCGSSSECCGGKCKDCCNRFNCKDPCDVFCIVINIISIILIIVLIVLTRNISFDSEISKSIAEELTSNFNMKLYMDFIDCSSSNDYPLNFDVWRGTVNGCGNKEKKNARILERNKECNKDEDTLDQIAPQKIISYKGITICPRLGEKSYYQLVENF